MGPTIDEINEPLDAKPDSASPAFTALMGTRFADGGSSSPGRAAASAPRSPSGFAAEGADVAIVARTLDRHDHLAGSLQETAARMEGYGGKVAVIVADLADGDDRQRIVPEAEAALGGPIDILVNNAAAAIYAPTSDVPAEAAPDHLRGQRARPARPRPGRPARG